MTDGVIQGIDVSNAQGDVDWSRVRDAGFRFGIAKATEGADFQDKRFISNMRAIAELEAGSGFLPGAYHFGRPDNRQGRKGGETEATWFCRVLEQMAKQTGLSLQRDFMAPVLDMEKYDESDTSDNIDWVEGFLSVVEGQTGRTGMIYTGPNYWRYQMADTDRFAARGIPLWQVTYRSAGADPAVKPPRMPREQSKTQWVASLWQWSGGGDFAHYGRVPGIGTRSGVADVNRLMGDESLLARLGATSGATSDATPSPRSTVASGLTFPERPVNLRDLRGRSNPVTARVQGLLLSHGYGPQGLVASRTGRPDGMSGSSTESALVDFKTKAGLPSNTVVDAQTWHRLVGQGLNA